MRKLLKLFNYSVSTGSSRLHESAHVLHKSYIEEFANHFAQEVSRNVAEMHLEVAENSIPSTVSKYSNFTYII